MRSNISASPWSNSVTRCCKHLDNCIPFYLRAHGNQPGNNARSRAQPAVTTWCKAAQEQRRSWERKYDRGTPCPVKVRKIYFKNFRQFAKKFSNVQWKALWLEKSPKRYPPRKYMKKTSGNLQKNSAKYSERQCDWRNRQQDVPKKIY